MTIAYKIRGIITLDGKIELFPINFAEINVTIVDSDIIIADNLRRGYFKTRRNNPEQILSYDFEPEDEGHAIILWSYLSGLKKNAAKLSSEAGYIQATDIIMIIERFENEDLVNLCNNDILIELINDWLIISDKDDDGSGVGDEKKVESSVKKSSSRKKSDGHVVGMRHITDMILGEGLAGVTVGGEDIEDDDNGSTMTKVRAKPASRRAPSTAAQLKKTADSALRAIEEQELVELPFIYFPKTM